MYGWIKNPVDARDYLAAAPTETAPDGVLSAAEHILSILDQGPRPTCVAQAVAQVLRAERHRAGIARPALPSRAFLHFTGRATWTDPTIPGGNYYRAVLKAALKVGIPGEAAYSYATGHELQMPDWTAFQAGYDARIEFRYYWIQETGERLTDAIDSLLAQGKPVWAGIDCTPYFEAGNFSRGPAPAPDRSYGRGHGVVIAERLADGTYLIPNSWGERRGLADRPGWYWITREYLQHWTSGDFGYVELAQEPQNGPRGRA